MKRYFHFYIEEKNEISTFENYCTHQKTKVESGTFFSAILPFKLHFKKFI